MKTPDQIQAELEALKEAYTTAAKEAFHQAFKDLFARWTDLRSIGFFAYPLHFNDGSECPYRVRYDDSQLSINGHTCDDHDDASELPDIVRASEETIGYSNPQPNPHYDAKAAACLRDVYNTLRAFDDDVYEDVVGSHVAVTITPEGITTEDYTDHD